MYQKVSHTCLSNGKNLVIRPATINDAAALRLAEIAITNAGIGVVQGVDDIPSSDEEYGEQLKKLLEVENAEHNICFAVSEYEGAVIGFAQLERSKPQLTRHIATVSIGVHPLRQGIGIGRALMNYLLDWAKHSDNPKITRVELNVLADNSRARHLYESLGFELEGIRKRFVRNNKGQYFDDCIMALLLDETSV